jgi:Leucine-rich repeat (LRR) protein
LRYPFYKCTDIQDINGIEKLSDTLLKLDLSKNNLSTLRPLASLTNLVELALEQNNM